MYFYKNIILYSTFVSQINSLDKTILTEDNTQLFLVVSMIRN